MLQVLFFSKNKQALHKDLETSVKLPPPSSLLTPEETKQAHEKRIFVALKPLRVQDSVVSGAKPKFIPPNSPQIPKGKKRIHKLFF